jgi:hypothetical protein
MRQAWKRTLTDNLGLKEHLPEEIAYTAIHQPEREIRIRLALKNGP